MVSSACPGCHILLVEASNEEVSNLIAANAEAVKLKATEVSNSWGTVEFSEETTDDKSLDHPGIPILAAGGDVDYNGCDHKLGGGACYPAVSRYVIAVGGTKLTKESKSSRKWTEEVWHEASRERGTGSGCSKYETKPPWQTDKGCSKRTYNDVAADASVESPVSVCDTYISGCWEDFGGTSASSPFVAGADALSTSATKLLAADAFYKKPSTLFDVTKGSNGTCPAEYSYLCNAEVGYDAPTGEGTPDGVFESIAAATATGLATNVASTGAMLNGLVNPNGLATKYYLEYGTTESYGKKTEEASAGSGTSNLEEGKAITGLATGTSYHFRIVAVNSNGTTDGLDEVFTTPTPSWSVQEPPVPAGALETRLQGVSCTSSIACTAAGHFLNSSKKIVPLAEDWNGTTWSVQEPPSPAGGKEGEIFGTELRGVSCVSTAACTAVGEFVDGAGTILPLAERWNGTAWSVQEPPSPTGAKESRLFAVSCTSSTACTAVGDFINGSGGGRPLAESWNGTAWSLHEPPLPTGSIGGNLRGVSCTSPTACTAVGGFVNSAFVGASLAESWNGTAWSVQEPPSPTGTKEIQLNAVSCTLSTACTAAGYFINSSEKYVPLAESWNGAAWAAQEPPFPTGASFSESLGVSCTSSTSCMAVGAYESAAKTLADYWNGTVWSLQTPPNPGGGNWLLGVSCASSTTCIAVGNFLNSAGKEVPLAELYH
jgi:Subtilase family